MYTTTPAGFLLLLYYLLHKTHFFTPKKVGGNVCASYSIIIEVFSVYTAMALTK